MDDDTNLGDDEDLLLGQIRQDGADRKKKTDACAHEDVVREDTDQGREQDYATHEWQPPEIHRDKVGVKMEYEIREPGTTAWATCDTIEDARKELRNAWERGLTRAVIYIVNEDGTREEYAPIDGVNPEDFEGF